MNEEEARLVMEHGLKSGWEEEIPIDHQNEIRQRIEKYTLTEDKKIVTPLTVNADTAVTVAFVEELLKQATDDEDLALEIKSIAISLGMQYIIETFKVLNGNSSIPVPVSLIELAKKTMEE